jgi:hypothetical protein
MQVPFPKGLLISPLHRAMFGEFEADTTKVAVFPNQTAVYDNVFETVTPQTAAPWATAAGDPEAKAWLDRLLT